jgi:hypothetical protein
MLSAHTQCCEPMLRSHLQGGLCNELINCADRSGDDDQSFGGGAAVGAAAGRVQHACLISNSLRKRAHVADHCARAGAVMKRSRWMFLFLSAYCMGTLAAEEPSASDRQLAGELAKELKGALTQALQVSPENTIVVCNERAPQIAGDRGEASVRFGDGLQCRRPTRGRLRRAPIVPGRSHG